MSLDERYLKSGKFDPRRNPVAYQLSQRIIAAGDPGSRDLELGELADDMMRAIAVLEDQIAELRGSPSQPSDTLIHISEGVDQFVAQTGAES